MQNKALGVMNITPNSFSDGGLNLSDEGFQTTLDTYLKNGFRALDFGAESTAAKNAGLVDEDLEWQRIENFLLPRLGRYQNELSGLETFSLDTYRFTTFKKFEKIFRSLFPTTLLLWNDVSGVLDSEIDSFLKEYETEINAGLIKYVASFTFVTERERASFHMDYAKKDAAIIDEYLAFEKKMVQTFSHLRSGLVLDPAFGFSKTVEQNFQLLDFFISGYQPSSSSLLIGLSRKSFLREKLKKEHPEYALLPLGELIEKSEVLHRDYLLKLIASFSGEKNLKNLWLRVHDPSVFK